ncbi:MAG TPA: GNAT family N-acetyltransferase [Verrucomicrobiae bacterium]|nr:GNAT family N-acetyltransferase [Verrucomicrobiae bacterium]
MSPASIGLLEAREIEEVVGLFGAQLQEHAIATSTADLRAVANRVMADLRYGFMLVARAPDGSLQGVAYASTILTLEHGGVSGWLEELYVLPEWRGKGIGSRLLDAVIAHAEKLGWRAVDLEVDANHQRVISLYTRHQFQPRSRTRFYRMLGDETARLRT